MIALGDSQMGVVILPTVFYLSKVLSKLAIGLDRQPELIAHLLRDEGGESGQGETGEKVTLVEKSTNIVREAFIKCLTDRSGTSGIHAKPEGKRAGIYLMANLCLKLLFKVHIMANVIWARQAANVRTVFSAGSCVMRSKCLQASTHSHHPWNTFLLRKG